MYIFDKAVSYLGVGIESLHVVHELPAAQGAPPPLVHVGGAGPGLVEEALLDVILGQVTQQLALRLRGEPNLEEVQLTAADGVIPVDNSLGVIVIHEYVPEDEYFH